MQVAGVEHSHRRLPAGVLLQQAHHLTGKTAGPRWLHRILNG